MHVICTHRPGYRRLGWRLAGTLALQVVVLSHAYAGDLPTGGQVAHGDVSVNTDGAAMRIQQASDRAIVNWESFSIGEGFAVHVTQPNVSSAMLSRVVGADPSSILGVLEANGVFYLVNPNGVYFGPNASVDVESLVVSTLGISDKDFLAGTMTFDELSEAGVVNDGALRAIKRILLVGRNVGNHGAISAAQVGMAAADSVIVDEVAGSTIRLRISTSSGDISNTGTVDVASGSVTMQGRTVTQAGAIRADSATGDGGSISLIGSERVTLSDGSATSADAGANGDGGSVVAFSEGTAEFRSGASMSAKGGTESGDGGFIEVSGLQRVRVAGRADASAANGAPGTFYVDPTDITIVSGAGDIVDNGDGTFTADDDDNTISDQTIEDLLNGGTSVTLDTNAGDGQGGAPGGAYQAEGDIVQNADASIDFTGDSGDASFTLIAERDIVLNGGITASVNALDVDLQANRTVDINAGVSTNGGTFTSSLNNFDNTGGAITTDGGTVDLSGHFGTVTIGDLVSTAGGDGSIMLGGDAVHMVSQAALVTEDGAVDVPVPVVTTTAATIDTDGGTVAFSEAISGSGGITINAPDGTVAFASAIDHIGSLVITGSGTAEFLASTIATGNLQVSSAGNIDVYSDFRSKGGNLALASTAGTVTQHAGQIRTDNGMMAIAGYNVDLDDVKAFVSIAKSGDQPVQVVTIGAEETATLHHVRAKDTVNTKMNMAIEANNIVVTGDIEAVNDLTVVANETVTLTENARLRADANLGDVGDLTVVAADGLVAGVNTQLQGGTATITAVNGGITLDTVGTSSRAGDATLSAKDDITFETVAGNNVSITTADGSIIDGGDLGTDIICGGAGSVLTLSAKYWAGRVRDNDVVTDPGDGPIDLRPGSVADLNGNALETEDVGTLLVYVGASHGEAAISNTGGDITVGGDIGGAGRGSLWVRNDGAITVDGLSIAGRDNVALISDTGDITVPNTLTVLDAENVLTAADITGARTLRLEAPNGTVGDDAGDILSVMAERLIIEAKELVSADVDVDPTAGITLEEYDLLTLLAAGAAPGRLDGTITRLGRGLRVLQANRDAGGNARCASMEVIDIDGDGNSLTINGGGAGEIAIKILNGIDASSDGYGLTVQDAVQANNGDITFTINSAEGQDHGIIEIASGSVVSTDTTNDHGGTLDETGDVLTDGTVYANTNGTVTFDALSTGNIIIDNADTRTTLDPNGFDVIYRTTGSSTGGSLLIENARFVRLEGAAAIGVGGGVTIDDVVGLRMDSGTNITSGATITANVSGNADLADLTGSGISVTTIDALDPGTITLGGQLDPGGGNVTLASADEIVSNPAANPDIMDTNLLTATALLAIGTAANPLQVEAVQLDLESFSSSGIVVENTPGTNVTAFEAKTVDGDLHYTQDGSNLAITGNGIDLRTGNLTIDGPPVDIVVAADVDIVAEGVDVTAGGDFVQTDGNGAVTASGDVEIAAANIAIDEIRAEDDTITLTATGNITEQGGGDDDEDLEAVIITLDAGGSIGAAAAPGGIEAVASDRIDAASGNSMWLNATDSTGTEVDFRIGQLVATNAVNITAESDVIDTNGPGVPDIIADSASVISGTSATAASSQIDIETQVNSLAAHVQEDVAGNIVVDQDTPDLAITGMSTEDGDIAVVVGQNLALNGVISARDGEVNLTADGAMTGAVAGTVTGDHDVTIEADSTDIAGHITSNNGQVTVTATGGDAIIAGVTADDDVLVTGENVDANGDVESATGQVTITASTGTAETEGVGADGNVTIAGPTGVTSNGNITSLGGEVNVTSDSGPASVAGISAWLDILVEGTSVTGTGPIDSINGEAAVNATDGDVFLSGLLSGQTVDVQSTANITLDDVTARDGFITLNAPGGFVHLNGDLSANGSDPLTIFARDEIEMADGILIDADAGPISLTAGADIALSRLTTTGPTVDVTSTGGAITDNLSTEAPNVDAATATFTANSATGSGAPGDPDDIDTTVTAASATVTGDGGVGIHDTDDLELLATTTADGPIMVTAQSGDLLVSGPVTAGDGGGRGLHDIELKAGDDLNINANVTGADDVYGLAYDDINLAANIAAGGRITLRADYNFDTAAFHNGVGAITQASGVVGSGGEELVMVSADGIYGTAADAPLVSQARWLQAINGDPTNTAAASGDIRISNGAADGGSLVIDELDPALSYAVRNRASGGIVDILSGAGTQVDDRIVSQNAITVTSLGATTVNGSGAAEDTVETFEGNAPITIVSGGDLTVAAPGNGSTHHSVVTNGGGSNIVLDSGGTVTLARPAGNVAVSAQGALTVIANANIVAGDAGTDTSGHMRARGGHLTLDAADDVFLNGSTQVVADGAWNVIGDATDGEFTMGPNAVVNATSGTVTLSAEEDVTLGHVTTTNATGDAVRITSREGGIYGTNGFVDIVADSANAVTTLRSKGNIGTSGHHLTTTIDTLDAHAEEGDVFIDETNRITLRDVDTGVGNITIASGAQMTALDVEAGITGHIQGDGNITLSTASEDMLVDRVSAELDTVNMTVAAAMDEFGADLSADIIGGILNLVAPVHIGTKIAPIEINGTTAVNALTAGAAGNDVVLTDTTGQFPVGLIDAGAADAVLVASAGEGGAGEAAITDAYKDDATDVIATNGVFTALNGIGLGAMGQSTDLDVELVRLIADVIGPGPINIDEVDDLIVTLARTVDGNATVRAGFNGPSTMYVELVDADDTPTSHVSLWSGTDIIDGNYDGETDAFSGASMTLAVRDGFIGTTTDPLEIEAGGNLRLAAANPAQRGPFWAVLTGVAGGIETLSNVKFLGVSDQPPGLIFWNWDIVGGQEHQMYTYGAWESMSYRTNAPYAPGQTPTSTYGFVPADFAVDAYWHRASPLLDLRDDGSTLQYGTGPLLRVDVVADGEDPFVYGTRRPAPIR